MTVTFENRILNPIPVSMAIAVLSLLILPYTLLILLSAIVFGLIYYYGKNALLIIILLNYLTSLTEYIGNLRIYLNILASAILLYLFLKDFGFEFKNYPKLPKSIIIFLIFLFTTLTISTLFSQYPFNGFSAIIRMGIFMLIAYLFYALIKDINTIYLYISGILISFVAISIRMFYDLLTLGLQDFFVKSILNDNSELTGSVGYTNFTIFFISITLISALFLLKRESRNNYFLLISLLIINIATLIFANARAAIFAAILSNFFLFAIFKTRLLIKVVSSFIFLFAILYFFVPEVEATIDFYLRIDTINQRDMFWKSGLAVISQSPIVGVGPETFPYYFFSHAPSFLFDYLDLKIWNYRPTPHSTFLLHWAESGFLGLVSVISLFIIFFFFAIKTIFNTNQDREYYIMVITITGIGIGILFRAFFEVTGVLQYGFITTDLPFWLLFGILIHIYQRFKPNSRREY
jgi:O-antigen ligase